MNTTPSSTADLDAIIVGSGINSLVCAAMLAKAGTRVLVLERESHLGGCMRTDALTQPGFLHDTLSTAHPQFVSGPAYAALKDDLHAAGLRYCNTETPTGVLLPDGRHLVLHTSRQKNLQAFEQAAAGDGQALDAAMKAIAEHAPTVFGLLGQEIWRWQTLWTLVRQTCALGPRRMMSFAGSALAPARHWLEQSFASDLPRALLAPWVLHCGLGPDAPGSALMAQLLPFLLESTGMPIVQGGNANAVAAFARVIRDHGGRLETGAHVARVLVEHGHATGVQLADGRRYQAAQVICNVTPTQLYGQLLEPEWVPPEVAQGARGWRYGKGNMQIHLALSQAPRWPDASLSGVCYLHLSAGPQAVARAVSEAERGLLPAQPTVCVAQPTALDPSRAPEGQHVLWIQLPECPREPLGDAAGRLAVDPARGWTPELREAFADRVIDQIARQVPGLRESIVGRAVLSPRDLERLNMNLVGGDPYGGDCGLDQYLLWRPSRHLKNHETPVRGLWHIGASTHPGPGLGGVSGLHASQAVRAYRESYRQAIQYAM